MPKDVKRAYFDTAFVVKCYVRETASEGVRDFAATVAEPATSELARTEFAAAIHRRRREAALTRSQATAMLAQFDADCADRIWTFVPISSTVINRVVFTFSTLPITTHLRAADAMHCATAPEIGLKHIYSNDNHLVSAAHHCALKAVNLSAPST